MLPNSMRLSAAKNPMNPMITMSAAIGRLLSNFNEPAPRTVATVMGASPLGRKSGEPEQLT